MDCIVELRSDEDGDLEANCARVEEWVKRWTEDRKSESGATKEKENRR